MTPYYEDASVRLYHGDCREIIPQLEDVDAVLTDPPFSDATHSRARSNRGQGADPITAIDFTAIDFTAIDALMRMLAPKVRRWFVGTLDWRHIAQLQLCTPVGWEFVRFGVWVKTNPMPQLTADRPANGWDGIAYLHKSDAKKRWNGGGTHGNWIGPVVTDGAHPTGKPEPFFEKLVLLHTDPGELILDPFAGSGTTGVVAKRQGRRCILIEKDEKYCEVAAGRLSMRWIERGGLFSDGDAA